VKRTGSNAVVPNYAKSESAAVPVYWAANLLQVWI
jgi:hypothetical protein